MNQIKKLVGLSLSLAMCLSTTVFAKPVETTTYKTLIKGDMNGVATEIEATIYNYIGELTFECPMLTYNEDFTAAYVNPVEKTFHVARTVDSSTTPQISFKIIKGSNLIQVAESYPGSLSYGYGDINIEDESLIETLPHGFYGSGQVGIGSGDANLATIKYFHGAGGFVSNVYMDYYTADYKSLGYVYMDDILILKPEQEERFLKTGTISEWDNFNWPGLKELLTGTSSNSTQTSSKAPSSNATLAQKSSTQVLVNGKLLNLDAYLINNNNYFKLRDFAYMVNDSEKQFSVSWDAEKKAISLTSSAPYESEGTELAVTSATDSIKVVSNAATLYKDNAQVDLSSYVIHDHTYFKLRDLAKLFNIGVDFDAATRTVSLDTGSDYVE